MKKRLLYLVLFLQLGAAFFGGVLIYMLFAAMDSEFGADGLFTLLLQLIFAVPLTLLTILLCLLVGLPIRMHKAVREWWMAHYYIPILGFVLGIVLFYISYLPQYTHTVSATIDGIAGSKSIPNPTIAITAWFITLFMLLHFFPPGMKSKE